MKLTNRISIVVASGWLLLGGSAASSAQTETYAKLGELRLSILGVHATIDPTDPVVPKNTASAVRIVIRSGDRDLTPEETARLLGPGVVAEGELSGPGLRQTLTLPHDLDNPATTDPLLLPLPPLPVAGSYALTNLRLVEDGRSVLDVTPEDVTLRVIDQILVTSVKTRALSLDEIRDKGIVLDGDDYLAFEFTMGLKLDSQVVDMSFTTVFDRDGVAIPVPQLDPTEQIQRDISLPGIENPPFWRPMLLTATGAEGSPVPLTMPDGRPIQIPSVLVIPGNVGYLKQFFSAQLYVANGAPGGSNLTVHDVTGKIHLPRSEGNADCEEVADPVAAGCPLTLPQIQREGQTIVQPLTMPVLGAGPDAVAGTSDDVESLGPGEQGQAEFLLRGEKEGFHSLSFDVAATLEGLPVGPVQVTGRATGGVLVRNARFDMTFVVPNVVRAKERFKVFATIHNIGEGDANDVTLTLDASRMAGLNLLGASSQGVEFIKHRDSWTAEFEFEALRTGQVTASYLRFDAADPPLPNRPPDASGQLSFTVGLGERGVALSPDTLTLPSSVDRLPSGVVEAAMRVLGQAWSVANAPTLPSDVTRISRKTVYQRALALAEVGLRNTLGQSMQDALRDLAFDFYGGQKLDAGFDQLLRRTDAGQAFGQALGVALTKGVADAGGLDDYQLALSEVAASGSDFIAIGVLGGPAILEDGTRALSPSQATIPGGAFLPVGDQAYLGLVTAPTSRTYTLELPPGVAFSLTFPLAGGQFGRVTAPPSAYSSRVLFDRRAQNALLLEEDTNSDGVFGNDGAQPQELEIDIIEPSGPRLTAATVVGPEILNGASPHGLSVAVLFDRIVDAASAAGLDNYAIPENRLVWAKRQLSGRLVLGSLERPEGPYVPSSVSVEGVLDSRGVEGIPATVALASLLQGGGAVVSGHVVQADGTPAGDTNVYLYNFPPAAGACQQGAAPGKLLSAAPVDADGRYGFHFVRWVECGRPFTVKARDPETTMIRSVEGRIQYDGERVTLDIALIGRGSVEGTVRDLAGLAVGGARVLVTSLLDARVGKNTTADGLGRYAVSGITVGPVQVKAAKGVSVGRNTGRIERAGSTAVVDVTLDAGSVRVSGRYLRLEGGVSTPVEGGLVTFELVGTGATGYAGYAWTEADGSYVLEGMPIGAFRLAVRNTAVSVSGQAFPNDDLTIDLIEEVKPADQRGHVVGKVVFQDDSAAPGVLVAQDLVDIGSVGGIANYTYTNEKGEFDLGNVAIGRQVIGAITLDRARMGYQTVVMPETLEVQGVTIKLGALGTAEFLVLDPDGSALAGQQVRLLNKGITSGMTHGSCKDPCGCFVQTTEADGRVRFEDMPAGEVKIKALRRAGGVWDVANGDVQIVNEGETAYGILQFRGYGTVKATFSMGGGAGTGGEYYLYTQSFVNDGAFTCDLVPTESHRGTIPQSNELTVPAVNVGPVRLSARQPFANKIVSKRGRLEEHGDVLAFDVAWEDETAGELKGTVYLPDGVTPAGKGVEVRLDGPLPDVTVYTNASSIYAFGNVLPEGSYLMTVRDPVTGGVAQSRVSLKANQDLTYDVRLKGQGTVVVTALDGDEPLPMASVKLSEVEFPKRVFEGTIRPADKGVYVFDEVFEGRVAVEVTDPYARAGRASGEITKPGERLPLPVKVTETGTVKGRFLMPDQATPIPYASVRLLLVDGAKKQVVGQGTTSSSGEVGSFSFGHVPLGEVRIEAEDPLTLLSGSAEGTLQTNGEEIYVEVVARALGTVEGVVWQVRDGAPPAVVPNAELEVTSGDYVIAAFADAEGAYSVSGVPEGPVTVRGGLRRMGKDDPGKGYFLFEGTASGELIATESPLYLDLHMRETALLDVCVQEANGTEIAGTANVTLSLPALGPRWTETAPTGEQGCVRFPRVPVPAEGEEMKVVVDLLESGDRAEQKIDALPEDGHLDIRLNGLADLTIVLQHPDGEQESGSFVLQGSLGRFPFTIAQDIVGSVTLNGLACGPAHITARAKPGHFWLAPIPVDFELISGANPQLILTLEPSGTVTGNVVDESGAAVVGASLTLQPTGGSYHAPGSTATQDAAQDHPAGWFSFEDVPVGDFRLTVLDPQTEGRAVVTGWQIAAGATTTLDDITLDATPPSLWFVSPEHGATQSVAGGTLELALSDTIGGSQVDAGTLRVTYPTGYVASSFTSTEGGDGTPQSPLHLRTSLRADKLLVGVNTLRATVADHAGHVTEAAVTFTATGGTIEGTVTRAGEALGNALVRIGSQITLHTDTNGEFRQDGVKPGYYSVTATDPVSLLTATRAVQLADGGQLTVPLELPQFGQLAGTVHEHGGPEPAPGVKVTAGNRTVTTNDEGEYDLGYLPVGSYTVDARAPDGDRARDVVDLPEEPQPYTRDLTLTGIGALEVTVEDANGGTVVGAQVTVVSSVIPDSRYYGATATSGPLTFPSVLAGEVEVSATYAGEKGGPTTAVVPIGETERVTVGLADTRAPRVIAVDPPHGAVNVDFGEEEPRIVVKFDEPIANNNDDGDLQSLVTLSVGQESVTGSVALDATARVATFTPEGGLPQDTRYTVRVQGARDDAMPEPNVQAVAFASTFKTLDTTDPVLDLFTPQRGSWTSSAQPTIRVSIVETGSGVDLAAASMKVDGAEVTPIKTPNMLTYTPPSSDTLGQGPHTVSAAVKDRAGRTGTLAETGFNIDLTAPIEVALLEPADGATLVSAEIQFRARARDDESGLKRIEIRRDDGVFVATLRPADPSDCSGTSCDLTGSAAAVNIGEEGHTLYARAVDVADNVTETSPISVTVDAKPGKVTGVVYAPFPNNSSLFQGEVVVSIAGATATTTDGAFEISDVPVGTWTLEARVDGRLRARELDVAITKGQPEVARNLTLVGVGSVTGRVVRGSVGVNDASVKLTAAAGVFTGTFVGQTATVDGVAGRFTLGGVPVGAFKLSATQAADVSQVVEGTVGEDLAVVNVGDVVLQPSAVSLPVSLVDGNGLTWRVAKDGSLDHGYMFYRPQGWPRLEIRHGEDVGTFSGATCTSCQAPTEEGKREIVLSEAEPIEGLEVTRKVYVPEDGYFVRYLEILRNPSPDTGVTVDVTATSVLNDIAGGLEPQVVDSSSAVANELTSDDRWAVLDDSDDSDIYGASQPDWQFAPLAVVFSDGGAERAQATATLVDRTLTCTWAGVTLAPGETAILMHLMSAQADRVRGRAAAERLTQLPPEALEGLTLDEGAAVRNFEVPGDLVSSLPPLPANTGRVTGTVKTADGTPVPGSVEFRSRSLYHGQPRTSGVSGGAFTISAISTAVVPTRTAFDLAVEPSDGLTKPRKLLSDLAWAGDETTEQNVDAVYEDLGTVVVTVVTDAGSTPLGNASVTLRDAGGEPGQTKQTGPSGASLGQASFVLVPSGNYEVEATYKGYTVVVPDVVMPDASSSTASEMKVLVIVELPALGSLVVNTTKANGDPLAANYWVYGADDQTIASGNTGVNSVIGNLPPGEYRVSAIDSRSRVTLEEGMVVSSASTTTANLPFPPVTDVTVAVTVAGEPLYSPAVTVTGQSDGAPTRTCRTDGEGTCTLTGMAGAFGAWVAHPDRSTIRVEERAAISQEGQEGVAVTLDLPRLVRLSGVLQTRDGSVVSGYGNTVSVLHATDDSVQYGSTSVASFTFANVPTGPVRLRGNHNESYGGIGILAHRADVHLLLPEADTTANALVPFGRVAAAGQADLWELDASAAEDVSLYLLGRDYGASSGLGSAVLSIYGPDGRAIDLRDDLQATQDFHATLTADDDATYLVVVRGGEGSTGAYRLGLPNTDASHVFREYAGKAISGRVVSDAPGEPALPGLTVRLVRDGLPTHETATDSAGGFFLPLVPEEGLYDVEVLDGEGVVIARTSGEGERSDMTLVVPERGAATVTVKRGTAAVASVAVTLSSDNPNALPGDADRSATTDESGVVVVTLPVGYVTATVWDDLAQSEVSDSGELTADGLSLELDLAPVVANGSIEGVVSNGDGGVRVGGATVQLTDGATQRETTADAGGAFFFEDVPAGQYTITATSHGVEVAATTTVVGDAVTANLNLPLPAITGQVEDPSWPGRPLLAEVRVCRTTYEQDCLAGSTDEAGHYVIFGRLSSWNSSTLPIRAVLLDGSGVATSWQSIGYAPGYTSTAAADFVLPGTGILAGQVLASDGTYVADGTVALLDEWGELIRETSTDAEGRFAFPHVSPCSASCGLQVYAEDGDGIPGKAAVTDDIVAGLTTSLPALPLAPTGWLTVTLADGAGLVPGAVEVAAPEAPRRADWDAWRRWFNLVDEEGAPAPQTVRVPVGLFRAISGGDAPAASEGDIATYGSHAASLTVGSHVRQPVRLEGSEGVFCTGATDWWCDGYDWTRLAETRSEWSEPYPDVAAPELGGRALRGLSIADSGVRLRQQQYVPDSGRFARTFTLVSPSPLGGPAALDVPSEWTSTGSQITLVTTSSGDQVLDANDSFVVVEEETGALTSIVWGGSLAPSDVVLTEWMDESGRQPGIHLTHSLADVSVPRALLLFVLTGTPADLAGLVDRSSSLASLTDAEALTGLTAEERAAIANFEVP